MTGETGVLGHNGAPPRMSLAEIEAEASRYRWWHRIELAPGFITPGESIGEDTPGCEQRFLFPNAVDLREKSVLDIGAMEGFFSFQAEKRGASRVVAIDRDPPGGPDVREAFKLAAQVLNSQVTYRVRSVYDLEPSDFGVFDVVLMYGVLYHLKFPLYGLYRVASVCRELLVLETHVAIKEDCDYPLMLFYPGKELNGDGSTWWGANPQCVDAMIEHLGFTVEERATYSHLTHDLNLRELSQARYVVRCRRAAETPPPFSEA